MGQNANPLKTKLMAVQSGEWYYSLVVLHDVRWGAGGGGGGYVLFIHMDLFVVIILGHTGCRHNVAVGGDKVIADGCVVFFVLFR